MTDTLHFNLVMLLVSTALATAMFGTEGEASGVDSTATLYSDPNLTFGLGDEESSAESSWWGMADWSRRKKVVVLNLAVTGVIAIYGAATWDYGSNGFASRDEGWFDRDTCYGGADKLGHAWSAYAVTSLYSRIYRDWGYSDEDAILGAALSTWAQTTLIEIGDGLSKSEGFSWQDEAMNTAGVGLAYLRHRFPAIRDVVDFRWEWFPSPAFSHGDETDVFTDYSGQKYLLAFKPDGFFKTGDPILKALELQIGYYTRGYASSDEDYFSHRHRYGYIGIGLNVTYLLERLTEHRAAGVFDYYQVPHTYFSVRDDFN